MTKGGVDVVDRLKSEYSVSRISNRWPLTIFNGLLNVGAINAQIIYKANTNEVILRRKFLAELARALAKPFLIKRSSIPHLSISLKQKIINVLGEKPVMAMRAVLQTVGKPICFFCPVRKNRFTMHKCNKCASPICKEHTASTIYVCNECFDEELNNN